MKMKRKKGSLFRIDGRKREGTRTRRKRSLR